MPTPAQVSAVLEPLLRGPQLVRELIYEMPPELRKRRPDHGSAATPLVAVPAGMWSAHEHAVHLPAVQPIMMRRLDQMLRDPSQPIRSYEPSRDEQDGSLLELDLDAEMNRFESERVAIVERLRKLTPDQWEITAPHEEYSHYSIYIMFRHLALHDLHHAYKIEERLLRKAWD
jgi:hypothetical protein